MATWLRHKGIAPTPLTVDALIQFLRHLQGGEDDADQRSHAV